MAKRCLFCNRAMGRSDSDGFPRVKAAAYDAKRGRLWAICNHCHRWNLWPLEERGVEIERLERLARDRGVPLASTANVTLLRADDIGLVRVGNADLAERSWWRYGRELRRRALWYDSPAAKGMAYAYGALAYAGESLGLTELSQKIRWDEGGLTDLLRWRRFGWAAWRGRQRCPNCGSVLRALVYSNSWWLYPMHTEEGLTLGVPCPRCDFWKPENAWKLTGEVAETTLRRVLAYQNIKGAREPVVKEAAEAINQAGSGARFLEQVGRSGQTLWRMPKPMSIALEIAINESAERRVLQAQAKEMEFVWRREEELAAIIDDELTPAPNPPSLLGK